LVDIDGGLDWGMSNTLEMELKKMISCVLDWGIGRQLRTNLKLGKNKVVLVIWGRMVGDL
jgi:hypothetical protein